MRREYTASEREKALKVLRDPEVTLAEAHRRTKIPKGTLADWRRSEGVASPRTDAEKTRTATAARMAERVERRQQLIDRLIVQADDLIDRMNAPHVEYMVVPGGKDPGSLEKAEYDQARSGDVRNYAVALGILIDKMRLELGESTENIAVATNIDEVRRLRDELAERRALKAG